MYKEIYIQGIGNHDAIPANRLSKDMSIVHSAGIIADVIEVTISNDEKTVTLKLESSDGNVYEERYPADQLVAVKIKLNLCKNCIDDLDEYYPYLVSRPYLIITETSVNECNNSKLDEE